MPISFRAWSSCSSSCAAPARLCRAPSSRRKPPARSPAPSSIRWARRSSGATVKLLRDGHVVDGHHERRATAPSRSTRCRGPLSDRSQRAPGSRPARSDPMFVGRAARRDRRVSLPIGPLETDVTRDGGRDRRPAVADRRAGDRARCADARRARQARRARGAAPGARQLARADRRPRRRRRRSSSAAATPTSTRCSIDGIPANDIGGGVDLSQFPSTGVDRIEVLREPNSVVSGSDALAGVISITSRRGRTRIPEVSLSLDGGNLGTQPRVGVGRRRRAALRLLQRVRPTSAPTTTCRTTSTATRPMPAGSARRSASNTYVSAHGPLDRQVLRIAERP